MTASTGFAVTVVERTPSLQQGWGDHVVDLFDPAVKVGAAFEAVAVRRCGQGGMTRPRW
jgi:hypothetical protein